MTDIVDNFFAGSPAEAGVDALNETERGALDAYERTIEAGKQTFINVGIALFSIRDQRLYRETDTTFECYCRRRWGFSKTHANRIIEASSTALEMTPIGVKVENEAQAREYARTPTEYRKPVSELAIEKANGAVPTAKQIAEARIEILKPLPTLLDSPVPPDSAQAVVEFTPAYVPSEPPVDEPDPYEPEPEPPASFRRDRDKELRAYYIDQDRTNITSPNIVRCTAMGYAAYERSLSACVKTLIEMGILAFEPEEGYYVNLANEASAAA